MYLYNRYILFSRLPMNWHIIYHKCFFSYFIQLSNPSFNSSWSVSQTCHSVVCQELVSVYRHMSDKEALYLLEHSVLPEGRPYQTIVVGEEGYNYCSQVEQEGEGIQTSKGNKCSNHFDSQKWTKCAEFRVVFWGNWESIRRGGGDIDPPIGHFKYQH